MKRLALLFLFVCMMVSCGSHDNLTKIISYNIRLSTAVQADGENQWLNRRQATETMIHREKPDLFGIQEGILDQVRYIEETCPEYQRVGIGRDDGKEGGEIMAIFFLKSRYDLLDSGTFWLSETPDTVSRGWDAACNRTTTWVRLKDHKTGEELYFFNTHLDHRGAVAREESVKLLASKINAITADCHIPVLLTGDFNALLTEPFMKPLLETMSDARTSAPITDHKTSYNNWGQESNSVIDHIFGTGVTFLSFQTLDGDYGAQYISDHYPVMAEGVVTHKLLDN